MSLCSDNRNCATFPLPKGNGRKRFRRIGRFASRGSAVSRLVEADAQREPLRCVAHGVGERRYSWASRTTGSMTFVLRSMASTIVRCSMPSAL